MGVVVITDEGVTPATPADGSAVYSVAGKLKYRSDSGTVHEIVTDNNAVLASGAVTNTMLATDIKVGSLAALTTTEKASVVGAINEVDANADAAAALVGTLASLTTTAKTSAVAAINEVNAKPSSDPTGGPRYSVGNHGCTYSTLTAALAAISDASAAKPYTLEVYGAVAETSAVTAKSHVHVVGAPGASVTCTYNSTGTGINFNNITNSVWRGLTIIRAGAPGAAASAVLCQGTTDSTVRIEHCTLRNITTGANSQYGTQIIDSAQPIFDNCEIYGGTAGTSGFGVVCISSVPGPLFNRCKIVGGSGGASGYGAYLVDASYSVLRDCDIFGGSGGASCFGIRANGRRQELINCKVVAGSGGTGSSAIATGDGGTLFLRNCTVDAPIEQVTTAAISATTTLSLQATKPHQIENIIINCSAAASGGVTLSVGTTLAGTDIVNAYNVTSTGRKYPPLGTGIATLLSAGATLYVTVTPIGGGTATLTLEASIVISYAATGYGVYLTGVSSPVAAGIVQIDNCTINSNCASPAMYIDAAHVASGRLLVSNSVLRARRAAFSSPVVVQAAAMYASAPFYNCVFDGAGTTLLQPASAVGIGATMETQATPATFYDAPVWGRQYMRRWDIARAKCLAGVSGAQAVIALIGDSWAQDDNIGRHLRTALQATYGDAGPGYVSASNGEPDDQGTSSSKSGGGTWTEVDMTTPATAYGVDGSHITSTADTATWGITATFDTAVIHYIKRANGGTFQYQIDSGGWTDVDTASASTEFATEVVATGGAALNIRIKSGLNGLAGCTICGVDFREDGNGVRLHKIGNGGAQASHYLAIDSTIWSAEIAALVPDAVMILLGTNEMLNNTTPNTLRTNIETMVTHIRASYSPTPDIVLLAPSDNGEPGKTYTMAQMAAALRAAAQATQCSLVDLYSALGTYSADWLTEAIYYNSKHPDTLGGRILALSINEQMLA